MTEIAARTDSGSSRTWSAGARAPGIHERAPEKAGIEMRVVEVSTVAATLALVVFASASVVLADGRGALWSANSTHAHIGRLPNPENDAVDMTAAPAAAWGST